MTVPVFILLFNLNTACLIPGKSQIVLLPFETSERSQKTFTECQTREIQNYHEICGIRILFSQDPVFCPRPPTRSMPLHENLTLILCSLALCFDLPTISRCRCETFGGALNLQLNPQIGTTFPVVFSRNSWGYISLTCFITMDWRRRH